MKISRQELIQSIESLSDEQYKEFQKDHLREIRDISLWSKGEMHVSKNAFHQTMEIMNICNQIDDAELYASENPSPEATEEVEKLNKQLELAFSDFGSKVDSYASVCRLLSREADKFASMAEIFTKKKKSMDRRAEYMKEKLGQLMQQANISEIKGDFFKAKCVTNEKVEVDTLPQSEIETMDISLLRVKTSINETAVKQKLQAGEQLPWARLKEKTSVRFY